jgi:hypothetical protein
MIRIAAVLLASLLLVACAGAAEEEASPAPVPAEAFVAQAEEVCTGSRLELDPARREVFGPDPLTPADAQQTLERAAALLQTELADLRELEVPPDLSGEVERWLGEVEMAAQAYAEGAESEESASELIGAGDPLLAAEETADGLGMQLCGHVENRRQDPTIEADETP